MMLHATIEQEPGAGLDHGTHSILFEEAAYLFEFLRQTRPIWIQDLMIQGDRNRLVARFRQDRQRFIEAMVREAISVVAKSHGEERGFRVRGSGFRILRITWPFLNPEP